MISMPALSGLRTCWTVWASRGGPSDHGVDSKIWLSVIDDAFDGERGRNFIGSREAMFEAARSVS